MTERFPDNKPVSVTISAELANALLAHGPQLIDALRHQAVLAEQNSAERQIKFQADLEKRQVEHRRIGTQAYRRWRRLDQSKFKSRHFAMVAVAKEFDLDKAYIDLLIGSRRTIVQKYLRKRRAVSVATLYLQGKSNEQISNSVGVSKTSIKRIINGNKELVERVRSRLRQREARQ